MALTLERTALPAPVPNEVRDLPSFRAWIHTADLSDWPPIHFFNGQVWLEPRMEEIRTHARVKTALGIALAALVENSGLGFYLGDGVRFTSESGDFSTEADALVVLQETWDSGRVWLGTGAKTQADATEVVGSPDIVIEVVSQHSVEKDTDWHFDHYFAAEVREYWVIDARQPDIAFDIWKRTAKGYTASRKTGGWVKSAVLGHSFQLTRSEPVAGMPRFVLDIR